MTTMQVTNKEALAQKERKYQESVKVLNGLGYTFVQEAIADTLIIGEYNKTNGTWTKVTTPESIRTDRVYLNLAQAKLYGLEIIHDQ